MQPRVQILMLVLGMAVAAPVFPTEVFVRSLNSIDIAGFQSCSWGEGLPAQDHRAEVEIRATVEERLGYFGYTIVEQGGDCRIVSRVVRDRRFPVGLLTIEIYDSESGQIAWRGEATGIIEDNPNKMLKIVRKAINKMFKYFPQSEGS